MNKKKLLTVFLIIGFPFIIFNSCKKDEDDNRTIYSDTNYTFDYNSVTDIDGNTYRTIEIGDQEWMDDNLLTTTYNDGTPIYLEENSDNWAENLIGAYKEYDQSDDIEKYGLLYNWYAVETNKICPVGWHVPTDEEWKTLEIYLGMSQEEADISGYRGTNEGSKLAGNSNLWRNGEINYDSEFGISGFKALPGGGCEIDGTITHIGNNTFWWSTTNFENDTNMVAMRSLSSEYSSVFRGFSIKNLGMSIRCVKD